MASMLVDSSTGDLILINEVGLSISASDQGGMWGAPKLVPVVAPALVPSDGIRYDFVRVARLYMSDAFSLFTEMHGDIDTWGRFRISLAH